MKTTRTEAKAFVGAISPDDFMARMRPISAVVADAEALAADNAAQSAEALTKVNPDVIWDRFNRRK